jgi:hypothetical protein
MTPIPVPPEMKAWARSIGIAPLTFKADLTSSMSRLSDPLEIAFSPAGSPRRPRKMSVPVRRKRKVIRG